MPKSSEQKRSQLVRNDDGGFSVSGDMTFDTVRGLLIESKALFGASGDLKLDLAAVEHADSAGLALLLEWISRIEQAGGKVAVNGIPGSIMTIAKLCRIDSELESYTSMAHPKP